MSEKSKNEKFAERKDPREMTPEEMQKELAWNVQEAIMHFSRCVAASSVSGSIDKEAIDALERMIGIRRAIT